MQLETSATSYSSHSTAATSAVTSSARVETDAVPPETHQATDAVPMLVDPSEEDDDDDDDDDVYHAAHPAPSHNDSFVAQFAELLMPHIVLGADVPVTSSSSAPIATPTSSSAAPPTETPSADPFVARFQLFDHPEHAAQHIGGDAPVDPDQDDVYLDLQDNTNATGDDSGEGGTSRNSSSSSSSVPRSTASAIEYDVAKHCMRTILHACKKSVRESLYNSVRINIESQQEFTQSSAGVTAADSARVDELLADVNIVLSMDGEYFQLKAVDVLKNKDQYEKFNFFKFVAAMSFVQQPCDKTASYRLFKLHQKRGIAIATSSEAHQHHPYMQVVERAIRSIDSASRETFRKFFLALPTLLHVAFSPEHMSRGFHDTGLLPFDPIKILRHWPNFSQLTTAAVDGIIEACSTLTDWVIENARGYITYSEIYDKIEHFLPVSCRSTHEEIAKLDRVYEMQHGRWGAVWINTPSTEDRRAENALQQQQREARRLQNAGRGRGGGRGGGRGRGRGRWRGRGSDTGRGRGSGRGESQAQGRGRGRGGRAGGRGEAEDSSTIDGDDHSEPERRVTRGRGVHVQRYTDNTSSSGTD